MDDGWLQPERHSRDPIKAVASYSGTGKLENGIPGPHRGEGLANLRHRSPFRMWKFLLGMDGWRASICNGEGPGRARTGPMYSGSAFTWHSIPFPSFGTVRYGMYYVQSDAVSHRADAVRSIPRPLVSVIHPAFSAACDSACITSSVMLKFGAQRSRILGAPRQHEKEVGGAPF